MKESFKYVIAVCMSILVCACEKDVELDDDAYSTTIRTDDFIGRIYQYFPNYSGSLSRNMYQMQFFEDGKVSEKYWSYAGLYPDTEFLYNYEVVGDSLSIDGIGTFLIENEKIFRLNQFVYVLQRTDGERVYPGPSQTLNDIIGEDENQDENEKVDFKVRVSTVTGAGEVNFTIRILETEKEEASFVTLIYKIGEGGNEESKEARWIGKRLYTSYVIASKHTSVYYRVRVCVDGKIVETPLAKCTITS